MIKKYIFRIFLAVILLFPILKTIELYLFFQLAVGRVRKKKRSKKRSKMPLSAYEEAYAASVKWLEQQKQEEVRIKSRDGFWLTGHYFPSEEQKRILLAFHGWHGGWEKDFALCAKDFLESGCSLLLVEQRAQGSSGGNYIGFGVLERHDCRLWAEYLYGRFENRVPVYLYGVSMGASTVLMAGGGALPENVKGIIADCGFTTPYDIVVEYAKKFMRKGEFPDVPRVNRICTKKAGYNLKEYSTLDAVKTCRLPIFFIHGKRDLSVPYQMTLQNYNQCRSRKELMLVEGAGHCRSYFEDRGAYMDRIAAFFSW